MADAPQSFAELDDQRFPAAIRARIAIVDETARRNMDAINARRDSHTPRFQARGNAILKSPKSISSKFYALWELVDEMMAFNGKNVACKRGCSHCCHIAVAMTPQEAEAVGKRIGRTPRKNVKLHHNFKDFDYGYHNPCPFLKNRECSIYANRPLPCRVQYSLDSDALLCELGSWPSGPVPYINPKDLNVLALKIAEVQSRETLADIREFFPRR